MLAKESRSNPASFLPVKLRWALLVALLCALLIALPMLWYGAPNGHSVYLDIVWSEAFSRQLGQGDLYPRWLMDLNRGAGGPTFFFYAPIPFYILAMPELWLPTLAPVRHLAIGDALLIGLSGLSFFCCATQLTGTRIAFLASLLYALLPYHFEVDLWRRQDLGELTNYIWLPLVFHFSEKVVRSRTGMVGLAISSALMIGSHLPSAILIFTSLAGYLLLIAGLPSRRSAHLYLFGSLMIGLLLAGIYWIPALFMQKWVHIERLWEPDFDVHLWLFPLDSRKLFGSDPDGLLFGRRLVSALVVTAVIFLLNVLATSLAMRREALKYIAGPTFIMLFTWFLMSPLSTYVWENTSLWKVQFPWRAEMLCDFATAVSAIYALESINRHSPRIVAGPVLLSAAALVFSFCSAGFDRQFDSQIDPKWLAFIREHVQNRADVGEYAPRWHGAEGVLSDDISATIVNVDKLVYQPGSGSISIESWRPGCIELHAVNLRETTLQVRQYYFPSWHGRINGSEVALRASPRDGLITLTLPRGTSTVILTLEPVPQQIIGRLSTVLGCVLVAVFVFIGRPGTPVRRPSLGTASSLKVFGGTRRNHRRTQP